LFVIIIIIFSRISISISLHFHIVNAFAKLCELHESYTVKFKLHALAFGLFRLLLIYMV